jgi:hypothetical protein
MKSTIEFEALYKLCNEENLFTCGSQEQYDKMFQKNDEGVPLKQIAAMIWICSDDISLDDVIYLLKKLQKRLIEGEQK